ncbi:MAG TPA: YkvA family protein [Baekduia sp.]|uniref:YkvA family protein n=1 Tax=Baekduia sp. TaxID=2600305 RepID=UPI002B7B6F53|nr:YkvA family protein [Baekduia sp.]HMJ36525.1 YkvA family protein [Baekduia sp.]
MSVAIAIIAGLLAGYVALVVALLLAGPKGPRLVEALRLLPDLLRLVARLGSDRSLPRSVRVRLWLLLAYLAMPFDLIPDFVPVLGYADDVIVVSLVLRTVVRRAGAEDVRRHWPGTDDGLRALGRLVGLALTPATHQT